MLQKCCMCMMNDRIIPLLTASEAETRLHGMRESSFLVRKNIFNEIIISYNDKKISTKHAYVPTNKSNKIRQLNPHLATQESILDYVLDKTHLNVLSYPLTLNDIQIPENLTEPHQDECDICGKNVGKEKRSKHKESHHKLTECQVCRKIVFPFEIRSHSQRCMNANTLLHCKFCDFTTENNRYLKKHEDDHTKKRFKCTFCVRRFESELRLNKHIQSNHSNESKLKCNHCSKKFSSVSARSRHNKEIHPVIDGQIKFRCRVCTKDFESEARHKRHMTKHKPNKIPGPFICIKCGKEFKTHYTLKHHKNKFVFISMSINLNCLISRHSCIERSLAVLFRKMAGEILFSLRCQFAVQTA